MKTESVWIQDGDEKLYGELYIPEATPAPAILICHGLNARGLSGLSLYKRLAKEASRKGYVSLVFDFRGVGRSTGRFDYGFGEQQDVKRALNYLSSRPEVLSDWIFVVGHSLGGAVSIYAVENDKRVRGLVLWSTPKNHSYNVKKFIRRTRGSLGLTLFYFFSYLDRILDVSKIFKLEVYGVNLRPRYVKDKLMKLHESRAVSKLNKVPLLIVVGDKDRIVGVDEAQDIFASANEPKNLLIISDADHIYKEKEQELISKTIEWIQEYRRL